MTPLARLAAVLAAGLAPLASLAQEAGGRSAVDPPRFAWLWIVAAALVVVALFRLLAARNGARRPNPPARHP